MTCFASVFSRKKLGAEYDHPNLLKLLNVPYAAEIFFSELWQSRFNAPTVMATSKIQTGWDFKTTTHEVEVKSCVGRVRHGNNEFQINKLQHKTKAHLCTLFDAPDNEYCMIGFAIPPSVWTPLMTKSGIISFTMTADYSPRIVKPELKEFLKYHTLYSRVTLSTLFDTL